ncbi:MAG: hypothetical protein FJW38_16365 [Acidobacteria bacterium]|nr:hypothetical protein [Acidobacteriota bacterium]
MTRRVWLSSIALSTGCGYHVGGKADLLPKSVKTIAVSNFTNLTARYKLPDRLTTAVTREFISRTRYQIIPDATQADAVLTGAIVNYTAFPTIFDANTGRAAGVTVQLVMQLTLTERATGKVLYTRPNFDIRERYEVSVDQAQYFEESEQALDRLSRDVARSLVSAVLSSF